LNVVQKVLERRSYRGDAWLEANGRADGMGIRNMVLAMFRGGAREAAEAVVDPNLGRVLDQQIRDGARDLMAARRALAVATASFKAEKTELDRMRARAADLEDRVVSAMSAGDEPLATAGASEIARCEASIARAAESLSRSGERLTKHEDLVEKGQARISALEAGRREAASAMAVLRVSRATGRAAGREASIASAEETLLRLTKRIERGQAETDGLEEQTRENDVVHRLAAAGYGVPLAPTAQLVLERLRPRALTMTAD
jgi:phage shock protein A